MLTLDTVLKAYACGVFPMAESRDDPRLFWVDPDDRGIIPHDAFHVPRSLAKTIRRETFTVRADTAFKAVMEGCAAPAPGRMNSWINPEIITIYSRLHEAGFAHSVEVWDGADLVGGLYGVSLGAAFFGESMFSRRRDASKIALVYLVSRLKAGGFTLLDTQFVTDHLAQFGAKEISRTEYHRRLHAALSEPADFYSLPDSLSGADILQLSTQTS